MSTYKITNVSNLLGKREASYNSILNIEYVKEMSKLNKELKPGEIMYMTTSTLPMSVHRLRTKGLITVIEINGKEAEEATKPKVNTMTTTEKNEEEKKHIHTVKKKDRKSSKDESSE